MALDLIWIAVAFLVIAVIAYALGARNLAWFSADIARIVMWIFVILFVIALIFRFIS